MSTSGSGLRSTIPPTSQPDATITQANPVSGTIYPVLAATPNCRILAIIASCTWTVQPTPLEVHVVIDGKTITFGQANPVSATVYDAVINTYYATGFFQTHLGTYVDQQGIMGGFLEGKSISVSAETTGGTVQELHCRVKYAKW